MKYFSDQIKDSLVTNQYKNLLERFNISSLVPSNYSITDPIQKNIFPDVKMFTEDDRNVRRGVVLDDYLQQRVNEAENFISSELVRGNENYYKENIRDVLRLLNQNLPNNVPLITKQKDKEVQEKQLPEKYTDIVNLLKGITEKQNKPSAHKIVWRQPNVYSNLESHQIESPSDDSPNFEIMFAAVSKNFDTFQNSFDNALRFLSSEKALNETWGRQNFAKKIASYVHNLTILALKILEHHKKHLDFYSKLYTFLQTKAPCEEKKPIAKEIKIETSFVRNEPLNLRIPINNFDQTKSHQAFNSIIDTILFAQQVTNSSTNIPVLDDPSTNSFQPAIRSMRSNLKTDIIVSFENQQTRKLIFNLAEEISNLARKISGEMTTFYKILFLSKEQFKNLAKFYDYSRKIAEYAHDIAAKSINDPSKRNCDYEKRLVSFLKNIFNYYKMYVENRKLIQIVQEITDQSHKLTEKYFIDYGQRPVDDNIEV